MARKPKLTPAKIKKFLEALAETGNVRQSCEAVDISRVAIYNHRKSNKKFKEKWEEAREIAIGALEDEAWRRAMGVGVDKYSDTLLMCLLQANKPEKYQYRQKVDANVSGNIKFRWMNEDDEKPGK